MDFILQVDSVLKEVCFPVYFIAQVIQAVLLEEFDQLLDLLDLIEFILPKIFLKLQANHYFEEGLMLLEQGKSLLL